jgi:plastocyanin
MRVRSRYLVLATVLGVALLALPALATEPTITAVNVGGVYGTTHYWAPSQAAVSRGGSVTVENPTATPHGVEWKSGPATPVCSGGVPVGTTAGASAPNWSGKCTFSKAGTYTFYCTVHGPEMTETITVTTPGAPTASTGLASSIGETEATLQGSVNSDGNATTYFFEYGKTESYETSTSEESAGAGSTGKAVSVPVGSLTPGTIYHYRLVAKNSVETVFGADRTFTTSSPPAEPSATTDVASGLGETEATLQGAVGPNGEATTYFFEWGPTSQYGQLTGELPAGEDHTVHSESAHLSGLAAGTVYHYRIVAKNPLGTMEGADQTFTTASTPPSPPPPPPSPSPPPPSPGTTPTTPQTPPTPIALAPRSLEPPVGVAAASLAMRSSQHGSSVKGALEVPAADAGGRLEVDLLARGASIARAGRSASVVVGRLIRSAVPAGEVPFAVKLNARTRSALRRHRKLSVTVRTTLTPKQGTAVTIKRVVSLGG